MSETKTVRVAAAQFHVGADVEANLANCLAWLDKASRCRPDLVVLPEFCNYLSWYQDKQHCFDTAVRLDGPFLAAIAERARELDIHVVVNCTVQRDDGSATGSSLLYSPAGELLADNTKQIYIGHENDFLAPAGSEGPVVATGLGRLGMYACMDGVINETPRCLALNGAQVMLNSLNSFATDEASLHIPVRAAENKVFVVAANKVGPLVPEDMVDGISAATGIPVAFLSGAGESQVVAPDGTVLAIASRHEAEYIFADIEVSLADDKRRPDGTDVFRSRRPELYRAIAEDPARQPLPPMQGPAEVSAAVVQLADTTDLDEACRRLGEAVAAGARLVALPPLPGPASDTEAAIAFGERVIAALAGRCGEAVVATSVIRAGERDGYRHSAVLVGADGLLYAQEQVHFSRRHAGCELGREFTAIELPIGRVAVLASDDSIYPETFRLLAMAGVEIAVVPLSPLEDWELATGLLERSAENRINLLVAPDTLAHGPGFITSLQTDFTVMTPWEERAFDGLLSQPEWYRCPAQPGISSATVRPANAAHKVVSRNTDLLANRPWRLAAAIVR
ncbi:MAG: carbon-nitrogen hydrolase family protein [Halieaceae bacterium]|nr:carbon-nitrogen hydrolase family protein [Halieaceae bacterium]MCP5167477.1 carbon-nitrogen hydrolase family protein [Pseudomonadales bacterium]MCP5186949.1 carbon-nitrogen hydrolase family protein [Pseudomonadales bacterium]